MDRVLNILIIEDRRPDFRLLERHLRDHGLSARCTLATGTAEEITRHVQQDGWDVVLMDYNIPDWDFGEGLAMIRERHPHVPVILLSSAMGEEKAVECLKQGISDFVLKDHLFRLLPAIERALRDKAEHAARLAAEAAQRASEERLALAMQATRDGLWDWDPQTNAVYLSPRWKAMLGYGDDELANTYSTWISLLHPDDAAPTMERLKDFLAGRDDQVELEYRLRHRDGNYVDILSRACVQRDADGRPLRVVGTHVDVSQRQRELKTFQALLEAAPDGAVVIDGNGRIVLINQQCQRLFGYGRQELIGQAVEIFLPERYRGDHVALRSGYQAQPRVRPMGPGLDLWARRKDGSEFPVEISLSPLATPMGNLVYAAVRDITDRRQTEVELRRSNAELEQFAYVAAHDLQEPLRQVSSYLGLLARRYQGRLDREGDEFIAYAIEGSRRMLQIINDVLAYSRVRGNLQLPASPVDCGALLDRVAEKLQPVLAATGGEIRHEDLPRIVADPGQLGMVFANLVDNAIKFQPHGCIRPPRIEVSAREEEDKWIFCVRDNGIGIDPRYHQRIFRIFQRLHSRRVYAGTGMGLALCKRIVEQHGGRIWLESTPGEGSAFFFSIPKRVSKFPATRVAVTEAKP